MSRQTTTKSAPVVDSADTSSAESDEVVVVRSGPHVPEGAKKPQDRQAKKKTAAQREAEGDETTEIEWGGLSLTIPASMEDASAVVALSFEEGKIASALRALVGPEQWAEVMKTKPKMRDLGVLFDTVAAEMGLESAGN